MQVGMVGLGRMGGNMARRLLGGGHQCAVFDLDPETVAELAAEGATGCGSVAELVAALARPRAVWIMVPAGRVTEQTVQAVGQLLDEDDAIIDGGNSFYKDDVRRARELAARGVHYVDAGTSGGVWGLERGYCLMIGGPAAVVQRLDPLFRTLAPGRGDVPPAAGRAAAAPPAAGPEAAAPGAARRRTAEEGYLHCGPAGAGHFVKMVHNGIEYGLMQAYAEGFDLLRGAGSDEVPEPHRYVLEVDEIAELWRRGSVVGSWLLDLTAAALAADPALRAFSGFVQDSGEGRWTIEAAVERAVPADVLSAALYARFRSRRSPTYGDRVLSAMRHQFGGHLEPAPAPSSDEGKA